MLNVSLQGDREVMVRLGALGPLLMTKLRTTIQAQTIKTQGHVIADKLHGQVLNLGSGKLAASIQQESPVQETNSVWGRVFSSGDVKYAAIHEFGGTTSAHDIVPVKAHALAFVAGGKQVFAKIVHHPGSVMPERSFLRSALADRRDAIIEAVRATAVESAAGAP